MAIHLCIFTGKVWFDNNERVWLSLDFEIMQSSANLSNKLRADLHQTRIYYQMAYQTKH